MSTNPINDPASDSEPKAGGDSSSDSGDSSSTPDSEQAHDESQSQDPKDDDSGDDDSGDDDSGDDDSGDDDSGDDDSGDDDDESDEDSKDEEQDEAIEELKKKQEEAEAEKEEEEAPNYTRLGFKGAGGDVVKWLEILNVLPNPGKTEICTGMKVDKILGTEYTSCFGATSEFVFDVKYLVKQLLGNLLPGSTVFSTLLTVFLGGDNCKGESKIIVGPEAKLNYGDDLDVRHGTSFEAEYPGFSLLSPSKNAGEIIVVAQAFLPTLLLVIGILDLAISITIKILMTVSGSSKDPESYKMPIAMIELISAFLLPKMQGLLIGSEKTAAELQMAEEAAESALESAEHFFEFALMRVISPGFMGPVTRAVAESEIARLYASMEEAAEVLAATVEDAAADARAASSAAIAAAAV